MMEIRYLTPTQIIEIHYTVMVEFDDLDQAGVKFEDGFISAALRPQSLYFGKELFPTLWDKVGALIQSIAQGHVFHNGNKRTAFAAAQLFLFINGYRLYMDEKEAEEMMVSFVTDPRFKGEEGAREIGRVIEENVKKNC